MVVHEIPCQTNGEYTASIKRYADETRKELQLEYETRMEQRKARGGQGPKPIFFSAKVTSSSALYYLRLAGDFAAIPDLHDKHPEWSFHAEEVYDFDWDRVPEDNPYSIHLETLVKSSTKLVELGKILGEMQSRSRLAMGNGEPKEKMVCTTAHPASLLLLYLSFKRMFQGFKVVLITAKMNPTKRTELIDGFCGKKDSPLYGALKDTDILLATTALVATGINITAANNFVLLDPLWMQRDQRQAFARVHRIGQRRQTHLYLLYSPGNPVEQGCLNRQRTRGQLGEMTWQVTTGEAEIERVKAEAKARREAQRRLLEDMV
jgi:SNF2 family DNA or RNA helicase